LQSYIADLVNRRIFGYASVTTVSILILQFDCVMNCLQFHCVICVTVLVVINRAVPVLLQSTLTYLNLEYMIFYASEVLTKKLCKDFISKIEYNDNVKREDIRPWWPDGVN